VMCGAVSAVNGVSVCGMHCHGDANKLIILYRRQSISWCGGW